MKQTLKLATLKFLKSAGVFPLVRDSSWRTHRLLILCYHGISLDDEHLWRPGLYLEPSKLEQRLSFLRQGGYNVLPLGKALRLLRSGELPPRSIVITFDDGAYDFFRLAHPLLKRFDFPATVYQTTYYSDRHFPIFNLICSYLLWKRRGCVLDTGAELGLKRLLDLTSEAKRQSIVETLMENCDREGLDGAQKNEVAGRLAKLLEIDYAALLAKRMLQLMNAREIAQLAAEGVDFQLHTHRHRTPADKELFQKEIRDNRERLATNTPGELVHFCYPSGVYSREFLPWLAEEHVISATTCDVGLASSQTNPLLLPRMVETSGRTALEFEGWVTGVSDFLALNRTASQSYVPRGD